MATRSTTRGEKCWPLDRCRLDWCRIISKRPSAFGGSPWDTSTADFQARFTSRSLFRLVTQNSTAHAVESRITDQDLTILTLLQLASLRELGLRLGMQRLALKALEAYAQLERYLFIDGQPTSMLIRGGDLRGVPQGCALSVHFCNLAGSAWYVCMNRELPHVRTNAYLDDRLVCAGSCNPLPRALAITKQVDDYFGAVLNGKKRSWSSTKLPSPRRRKLCDLIDYTRSLVSLGVDVLMRGGTRWSWQLPVFRTHCLTHLRVQESRRQVGMCSPSKSSSIS